MPRTTPLAERFWSKVDKRGPDECWPWTGTRNRGGYGRFYYNGKDVPATRVAMHLLNIDIPANDAFVCHSCDNPPCLNPAHLWVGTRSENMLDAAAKGRLKRPPWTLLTPSDVREIRRLYRRGVRGFGARALAKRFGVNFSTVRAAARGKTWKHI